MNLLTVDRHIVVKAYQELRVATARHHVEVIF